MKKVLILIGIIAVGICLYTCATFKLKDDSLEKIETIENQWSMTFPNHKTLLYQKDTVEGFHRDGNQYFVYSLDEIDSHDFSSFQKQPSPTLEKHIKSLWHDDGLDETVQLDFNDDYTYYIVSKDEFNHLYVLLFENQRKLYIIHEKI